MSRSQTSLLLAAAFSLLTLAAEPAATAPPPTAPDDRVGPLILVDESLPQVIALLERITGRMVIRSEEIPAIKVNFSGAGNLTRRQAVTALESLLALNGVAVLPEGDDFLKVVAVGKGAHAEAPPLFTTPVADLPDGGRIIARLFTLEHAPISAVEPLAQALVNKARGGSALALPSGNALLVTDALTSVKRVEALIARLDRPGEVLFLPLVNTRASEIVSRLRAIQSAGPRTAFAGEAGFEADETTNQVIVVAAPAVASRVREIVAKLDGRTNERTRTEVAPLRHIEAERVVKILESLAGEGAATAASDAGSLVRARVKSLAATTAPGDLRARAEAPPLTVESAGAARTGDPQGDGFSKNFRVVAEARTNSLILYGTDADFRRVHDVIAKVDIRMAQVRIEAVIVEVTLASAQASGLESFGVSYKSDGTAIAGGGVPNARFNASTPNTPGVGKPPLAFSGSLKDFSLDTVFNLARQDSHVKVLSSPVIVTSHNSPANIKVGQKQPIVTGTTSDLQNVNTTRTTVEYKDIGLQLQVTPRIGANGVVEMDVRQTIESIIGVTVIDKNEQPIIGTREANSYLTARSDETVVLAGLQSFRDRKTKGKVWLLGDIPWLGDWLFRPETESVEKTELIVFLKPHVLTEADMRPDDTTPGLRPESLTRPDAADRIRHGGFDAMNREITVFETEERERREAAAKRAAETPSKDAAKP